MVANKFKSIFCSKFYILLAVTVDIAGRCMARKAAEYMEGHK